MKDPLKDSVDVNPGLEEFTTRIKAIGSNDELISILKEFKIKSTERNRKGYEAALIKAYNDGVIS